MGLVRRLKKEIWSRLDVPRTKLCARLAAGYLLPGGYRRIYHCHIQKTAGTSLNVMFFSLGGEEGTDVQQRLTRHPCHRVVSGDKVFQSHYVRLINRGDYFYAFSHEPLHRLKLPDQTFTVTVVRDPVQRIVSLYRMILGYRNLETLTDHHRKQMKWLGHSFVEFLSNLPRERLFGQAHHFSRSFSTDEAFERIAACSHFFPTEDFDRGVRMLGDKLGLPLAPRRERRGQAEAALAETDLERLRETLEPEMRLYENLKALWETRVREKERSGT